MSEKIKKIIFCSPEYITEKNYGGLSIYINKITKLLNSNGINTFILVSSDRNKTIKEKKNTIIKLKIHSTFTKYLSYFSKKLFIFYQSYYVNKKLNDLNVIHNFQLVHFSNFENMSFFNQKKIPSLCRLSSLDFLWENNNVNFILKIISNFIERKSLKNVDLVLSPSTFLKKKLKIKYGINSKLIPQIFDEKFNTKLKKKRNTIITFGAISRGKGSDAVISKIHQILNINNKLKYIWVGNVDKRDHKSNNSFLKKLRLNTTFKNRISVKNAMKQSRLLKILQKSCLAILPSYRENSPNSCLEALGMGIPVVARENSGFEDLIINNKNGFLFKKNDETDMVKKIQFYFNLPNKKRRNIENYCIKSIDKFKSKHVFKVYLKIFGKLIDNK